MKRIAALVALVVMVLTPVLWAADAEARAGRGGTSGSRGSRGFSSPASPTSPTAPSRQTAPSTAPSPQPAPSRWGGLGGMLGGLVLGGLLGGLLFGGGFGSGIGLLEILIVAALAWFAFRYIRSRQLPQPATPAGYAAPDEARRLAWQEPTAQYGATAAVAEARPDLEQGLAHIRQMDPDFDHKRVADAATDVFFKVQAAWMARDMSAVADLLTPEMRNVLQADCDRLRAERKVNRLENIAVRTAEISEAWQEAGHDYVTVRFLASLLDYTTDESGARVLEGSRTEPVKFEEFWTFVRPVGRHPFRLTAIQQA